MKTYLTCAFAISLLSFALHSSGEETSESDEDPSESEEGSSQENTDDKKEVLQVREALLAIYPNTNTRKIEKFSS